MVIQKSNKGFSNMQKRDIVILVIAIYYFVREDGELSWKVIGWGAVSAIFVIGLFFVINMHPNWVVYCKEDNVGVVKVVLKAFLAMVGLKVLKGMG